MGILTVCEFASLQRWRKVKAVELSETLAGVNGKFYKVGKLIELLVYALWWLPLEAYLSTPRNRELLGLSIIRTASEVVLTTKGTQYPSSSRHANGRGLPLSGG